MLIKMRAVEMGEAVGIVGKMADDPIQDHANASRMTAFHEFQELFGRTIAACWSEQRRGLVAPRSVERVLSLIGISSICVKPISLT